MKQVSMYFKSDFTVILASEAQWGGCPFRIKLWTASPAEGRSITACFDGTVWHNCQLLSDGRLQICVNQGDLGKNQYIGIGTLKMDIEFYLTNADFNDHICNEHIKTFEPVFVDEDGEEYHLYLGNDGASTITTIGTLPAFYQAGLTPEERQALIDATAHAEEAAQSANTAAENANEKAAIATESARLANEARQQLTTTFNEKVAALEADYTQKKAALDADYESVKQSLGTDYANTKIALDADYTAKKAALDADYASVKATLSASYSEAIAGINNRMSAIEAQYVTDKAAWQAEVDAILAKFEQDFATAEAERESRVAAAIALANMAATQAGNVNAVLNGDNLTVTDKNGQSVTRNVRGPKGDSITMFPNVTIFGQPTIQESQISGFTAQNYVQFPFLVDFAGRPWQLDCSITTGADVSQQHNVFDSAFGLAFAFSGGKFVLAMSSNGTSWDLGATSGTHSILANTTYYIRISWNGTRYVLAYSTNKETWVDDIVVTSSASLASKQIVIGKSMDNRYIFNGSINMSDAHLTISGKIVWEGMDDAGLATRMAIDLSNIDDEGKQKLNEVAMEGEVGQKLGDLSAELNDKLVDIPYDSVKTGGYYKFTSFATGTGNYYDPIDVSAFVGEKLYITVDVAKNSTVRFFGFTNDVSNLSRYNFTSYYHENDLTSWVEKEIEVTGKYLLFSTTSGKIIKLQGNVKGIKSSVAKNTANLADVTKNVDAILADENEDNNANNCMIDIFPHVGVIGDSLSAGAMVYGSASGEEQGVATSTEMPNLSWPGFMERMTGMTWYNFSQSGMSAKSFHTTTKPSVREFENPEKKCEAYFVLLVHNDFNYVKNNWQRLGYESLAAYREVYIGSRADIDMADYNNNADTYYGNYAKIIQKIKAQTPHAKVFLVTAVALGAEYPPFNAVIRDMAELFTNVYVLDMTTHYPTVPLWQFTNGHGNAIGYRAYARRIADVSKQLMLANTDKFGWTQFINTAQESYIPLSAEVSAII